MNAPLTSGFACAGVRAQREREDDFFRHTIPTHCLCTHTQLRAHCAPLNNGHVTHAGVRAAREREEDDFQRADDGRMVIADDEEGAGGKKKRKRAGDADGYNSDDSDFDDLRGYAGG